MALELLAVALDAADAPEVAAFWGALLGREQHLDAVGALLPGDDTQVGLRFVTAGTEKSGPSYLHLHLTSESLEDQDATVARAVALGGRPVDVGQLPEEDHVVLADPGGNEFCVLGPGNSFVAGCGFLGEVTCDGTREVGLFWRDALHWQLVWDQDDETAVQSRLGGTKVSWSGVPAAPKPGRSRQRLELVADDLATEVDRLVELGATRFRDLHDGVGLADPDGTTFWVRAR